MSLPWQILSLLLIALLVLLTVTIRNRYRVSVKDIEIKSRGTVGFYKNALESFFSAKFDMDGLLCSFHYLTLILVVPAIGFAFFLHCDFNFMVIIVALIWIFQLQQRLYPGEKIEES